MSQLTTSQREYLLDKYRQNLNALVQFKSVINEVKLRGINLPEDLKQALQKAQVDEFLTSVNLGFIETMLNENELLTDLYKDLK